jgi:hypothetical protein
MERLLSNCLALGLVTETENEELAAAQLVEAFQAMERRAQKAELELAQARQATAERITGQIDAKLREARAMYPFLSLNDCWSLCEAQNPELFASASQGDPELEHVADPVRRAILAEGPAIPLRRGRHSKHRVLILRSHPHSKRITAMAKNPIPWKTSAPPDSDPRRGLTRIHQNPVTNIRWTTKLQKP